MIRHMLMRHVLGPTAATALAVEQALAQARLPHMSLPFAIAIQFYNGDQAEALSLARMLADIEPVSRADVAMVFARSFDVSGPAENADLRETAIYCAQKFPVAHVRSKRELTGHPDGCYGLWAGTHEELWRMYREQGFPYSAVFSVEADGVPLRPDWIYALMDAHRETRTLGKHITGARMDAGPCNALHVNGTLLMDLICWANNPSLHTCPPGKAWDQWHADVMLREVGPSQAIFNLYGAQDVSLSVFATLGLGHAWMSNVKDGSARKACEILVLPETAAAAYEPAQEVTPSRAVRCAAKEPEKKASDNVITDIVLTTFPPDYDWLPYLLRSLERVTGYRNLLVLLEESYPVPDGLPANALILRKKDYAPGVESGKAAAIERLGVFRYSDARAFVFVDSDCVFTRLVDIQTDPTINIKRPVVLWRAWEDAGAAKCWKRKTANLLGYEPTRETMCQYPFQFPRSVLEAFWAFVGGAERMWATDFTDWNAIGNFSLDKMPEAVTAVEWSNHGASCIRQFWSHYRASHPEVQRELRALGLL